MGAASAEGRETEENRRILIETEESVDFCINSEYEGVIVGIQGVLEKGCDIVYTGSSKEAADTTEIGDTGDNQIRSSCIGSLDISAYSKKSIPLIRHIITKTLNTELIKHRPHHKISLSFTVYSSKRYLIGVVEGLNELFRRLSIRAEYHLKETAGHTSPGEETGQSVICSASGEVLYSVWIGPFNP